MLLSLLLSGGDFLSILAILLLTLPIMMLALSVHETAHGFVAWRCGDNTAYNLGRLTLNPIRHLDPAGFVCLLIFGFGWAKPVPINTRNFRNPKRGMALSALALARYTQRQTAPNAPSTGLSDFLDRHYPDERIVKVYPNAILVEN